MNSSKSSRSSSRRKAAPLSGSSARAKFAALMVVYTAIGTVMLGGLSNLRAYEHAVERNLQAGEDKAMSDNEAPAKTTEPAH